MYMLCRSERYSKNILFPLIRFANIDTSPLSFYVYIIFAFRVVVDFSSTLKILEYYIN